MTPEEARAAMRDALATELQLADVAGLSVADAYAAADRALDRAGYLVLIGYAATADLAAGQFKTELTAGPGLSPDAAALDADWTAAGLALGAHDINGGVLTP